MKKHWWKFLILLVVPTYFIIRVLWERSNSLSPDEKSRYTIATVYDYEDGWNGKEPVVVYEVKGKAYKKRLRINKRGRIIPDLLFIDTDEKPRFVTGDHYFIKFSEEDPEKSMLIVCKRKVHFCLTKNYPTDGWERFPEELQPCETAYP